MTNEYISRVNRVLDYIEGNISKDFSLDELAGVAAFSKYHFHRVFYSVTGETLFQFIQRVRIERAAYQLLNYGETPVTEIALDNGFSGSASFARAFKAAYGVSATEWRRCRGCLPGSSAAPETGVESNTGKRDGNSGKAPVPEQSYTSRNTTITRRTYMSEKSIENKHVEVKMFPETTVAYVRYVGPYAGDEQLFAGLYEKLFTWAGARDLIDGDPQTLIIYHDNPEITEDDKLRLSVCLAVPEETEVSGEIGKLTIPEGKYVFANFDVDASQFGEAWNWVYGQWLPASGYEPDDRPCFELYCSEKEQGGGKFNVHICVPVRPA